MTESFKRETPSVLLMIPTEHANFRLSVKPEKKQFLSDCLKRTYKLVTDSGGPQAGGLSFIDIPGVCLNEVSHQVTALRILYCLDKVPGLPDEQSMYTLILKSVLLSWKDGERDEFGFLNRLQTLLQAQQVAKNARYSCLIFLQPEHSTPTWIYSQRFLGCRYRPVRQSTILEGLALAPEICGELNSTIQQLSNLECFQTTVFATNAGAAACRAEYTLGVIAGAFEAINWSVTFAGHRTMRSGTSITPEFMICRSKAVAEWFPRRNSRPVRIPFRPITAPVRHLLEKLKDSPEEGSPKDILADALYLYALAVDETTAENEFLGIWRVLEKLSLVKEGNTKTIANNLSNLFVDGERSLKHDILAVADLRNSFVHRGEFGSEESAANLLIKHIAKLCLSQFANIAGILENVQEVKDVMSKMTLPEKQIGGETPTARVVRKIRALD